MMIHVNPPKKISATRVAWAAGISLTVILAALPFLGQGQGEPAASAGATGATPDRLKSRMASALDAATHSGGARARLPVVVPEFVLDPVVKAISDGNCEKYSRLGVGAFAMVAKEGQVLDDAQRAAYAEEQKLIHDMFATTCADVSADDKANWLTSIKQLALRGDVGAKAYLLDKDSMGFLLGQINDKEDGEPILGADHDARKAELISQAESLIDAGNRTGLIALSRILINDETSTDDDTLRGIALLAVEGGMSEATYRSGLAELKEQLDPDQYAAVALNADTYRNRFSRAPAVRPTK